MYTHNTDDTYFDLRMIPASKEAINFISQLSKLRQKRRSDNFEKALGALVGDLLSVAKRERQGFGYRPLHRGSFTGEPIGFRGFKDSYDILCGENFIETRQSKQNWGFGACTRMRATDKLIEAADAAAVRLMDLDRHFVIRPRPTSIREPVRCFGKSRRSRRYERIRGEKLPLDDTNPIVIDSKRKINAINAYMADQTITPDRHKGFIRLFHDGDRPGYDYKFGGRIYSVGNSYQHMLSKASKKDPALNDPENMRQNIRINGENTVEIDIKACFPTIIHARMEMPFDPRNGYEGTSYPRAVVKAWVGMTLSKTNLPRGWTKKHKEEIFPQLGIDASHFPIKEINRFMITHMPIFRDWHENTIHWGDLQFLESSAMLDCVWELATTHNVPSLPVHDSIIVPQSKAELAEDILRSCFNRWVGVEPVLERKERHDGQRHSHA